MLNLKGRSSGVLLLLLPMCLDWRLLLCIVSLDAACCPPLHRSKHPFARLNIPHERDKLCEN